MNYDFLITDIELWPHPEFAYRVVYHLGYNYGLHNICSLGYGTGKVGMWADIQAKNKIKLTGYIEQMLVDYAIVSIGDQFHVYCNEWVDDVVLTLTCPDDNHFLKPAFVEHLGIAHVYR